MTSSSTAERIPISTYKACNGSYDVDDATLPPFVTHKEFRGGAITELEWKEFCHLADANLRPINRLRRSLKIILIGFIVLILSLFIFIFFGYDQPTKEYFQDHPNYWLIPLFTGILLVTGAAVSFYAALLTKNAFLRIQHLCEEQSKVLATTARVNNSLLVSFHLCDERSDKGANVHTHDKAYTGDEYFHHPFRTYHNVYILAVVTMVDPEDGGFSTQSKAFHLPVKFPSIEFDSNTEADDSTLGYDTVYTSFDTDMTTTEDIVNSVRAKELEKKKRHMEKCNSEGLVLASSKKKNKQESSSEECGDAESKIVSNKSKKKKKKGTKKTDKSTSKTGTSGKKMEKNKKAKNKSSKSQKKLDAISEAS